MEGLIMPTPQAPIGSGFGPASTAAEVIAGRDLTGKTIVVTGGYSGIGAETVRAFRSAGANAVVPARDMAKANLADMPDVRLDIMNLLDLGSIDAFAEQFLRDNEKLHILVNNVGIMAPPLERDTRGYESQFAANHFGHFQLTCRLWPALVAAEGARVVALSSYGHRRLGSIFTIPISSAVSTTLGSLMGSRKRPMPCSPWRWTRSVNVKTYALSRCIPEAS